MTVHGEEGDGLRDDAGGGRGIGVREEEPGAIWEIFEFSMDQFFGMDMQKEMLGDPSGLTDTMWDLIVDTVGAALIALMGFGYLRTRGNESFLEQWIDRFIEANPGLFRRSE